MTNFAKRVLIVALAVAPVFSFGRPFGPGPGPRPFRPLPPPPPPRYHHHWGGEWAAVGGIAYLTGSIIRATNDNTVVVYDRTPVVSPNTTVIVQDSGTQVAQVKDSQSLKTGVIDRFNRVFPEIPLALVINSYTVSGGIYSSNMTTTVAVNGKNYQITTGGSASSYSALLDYMTNELVSSVNKIKNS